MGFSSIRYKSFTFPHNPETSTIKCSRSYVKHKYPELAGNELEDFGPNAVVITGNGEFFGSNAYAQWKNLYSVFQLNGVGAFFHPVCTQVTRGLMTELQADLEPRPNYVKYSFEVIADTTPVINECVGNYAIIEVSNAVVANVSPSSAVATQTNSDVHVVVAGECLSVICYNYSKKYFNLFCELF